MGEGLSYNERERLIQMRACDWLWKPADLRIAKKTNEAILITVPYSCNKVLHENDFKWF